MAPPKSAGSGLVYSTETGKMCPGCKKPIAGCTCKKANAPDPGDGIVRVSKQTKGRKGKGVTLITGLALPAENLKKLAKKLKQKCGSGGAIKNGVIEIQGDHRDSLVIELKKLGYSAKRAGG